MVPDCRRSREANCVLAPIHSSPVKPVWLLCAGVWTSVKPLNFAPSWLL